MTHYFKYLETQLKNAWKRPLMSDYGASSFTGHDIAENMKRLHILFGKAGLSEGDKVALYGGNSSRWAMAFLAVETCGEVVVPLLSDFRPEDASNLAVHSGAAAIFVQDSAWKHFRPEEMPDLRLAVSLDDYSVLWSRDGIAGGLSEAVMPEFGAAAPCGVTSGMVSFPVRGGDELAVINYTSGTTSSPKGVMLTYDNLNANVNFCLGKIPPRLGDEIVSMLPMAHMYGLMCEFLYPVCGGVQVHFLCKAPTPALLSRALADVRPYLLITVPLVMEKIIRSKVLPVVNKPLTKVLMALPGISSPICGVVRKKVMAALGGNVRQIIMGGAALNPDVEKCMSKLKIPYTVGYGMTEAAPLLAYEDSGKFAPGSCGKPAAWCEVRIDSSAPTRVPGEIQARGMNVMKGYFRNEEATAGAFTDDGWLRTGDLGVMDSDGNIFIRGRSKNMLLSSNGQNIFPEEIEAVVNSIPNVRESVVVQRGSALVALVYMGGDECPVPAGEMPDFIASALRKINTRMPSYSRVSALEIVPEPFVKTPKQSIRRFLYS